MTFEQKMAAIDRYFDNISAEEFNRILEEKYGIPRVSGIKADAALFSDRINFI
jgi:hypothetical protein